MSVTLYFSSEPDASDPCALFCVVGYEVRRNANKRRHYFRFRNPLQMVRDYLLRKVKESHVIDSFVAK